MKLFVVPEGYEGGVFYNESKQLVAEDYDGLLAYFRNLNGMTATTDIDTSSLDCIVYKAFSISGTAYMPTSFYYDKAVAANRVYGVVLPAIEDICTLFGKTCVKPVVVTGDIVIEAVVCADPVLGDVTIASMSSSDIPVNGFGDWTITEPDTELSLYNRQVTMTLFVFNTELPEDPSAPGDPLLVAGEQIAVIGADGRPSAQVILDDTNSSLPADTTLIIDTNGMVRYYGLTTTTDSTGSAIELEDIVYNV